MKRKQLLKPLFLLCALLVGGLNSAWGQDAETIASFVAATYNGGTTNGWNVEASYATAGGGYYQLTASDKVITTPSIDWGKYSNVTITIKARTYGGPTDDQKKISVMQGTAELTSYSPSGTSLTNSSELGISPLGNGSLTISCPNASNNKGSGVSEITIKGISVSDVETCATPTFSPAAGAVTEGTEVTISSTTEGATIYYTTDGSTPTTSSTQGTSVTINEACTLKAIAVKKDMDNSAVATAEYTIAQIINGYTIDFESSLDSYVDWTISNAVIATGTITAHGGTYYATTGGKEKVSFQTKEKIELPGTFTCYISKIGTNTNANSKWYVQVSEDGTTWTDVNTHAAGANVTAGTWDEITANLDSYSNVYVRLYYDGTTAIRTVDDITLTMRDPNAKATPTVTIDATGLTTTDMAGATDVAAGTLTATVASGETTITSPAVTWNSSNTAVATIDASTGAVTLKHVGTTIITAAFAGNDNYNEATATYELTVIDSYAKGGVNNPYTVAEAIAATPATGTSDNVYIKGIVSAFYNTSITGDDSNYRYYISDDGTTTNQLLVYKGKGLNNVAFDRDDDLLIGDEVTILGGLTTYQSAPEVASGNYIVSLNREKDDATIVVSDAVVPYGTTYTLDDSKFKSGDITLKSSNTAVATVKGLVITTVAVGTTIITVETAENDYYNAGSETFTLTVTAPEGKTTAAVNGFNKVTTTAGITDGDYLIVYEDGNVAFNGGLKDLDVKSNTISVTIADEVIEATETTKAAVFTINTTAGTLLSKSGNYIGANKYENSLRQSENESDFVNSFSIDNNGDAVIGVTFTDGTVTMRYNKASDQARFRYYKPGQQAIQLYKLEEADITVTLNASGYASYCSEYPLDFTNAEADGYSAWQITAVDGSDITFEQITGSVKGGTGVLLKGEAGATIKLTSVASTIELTDNKLVGTLAPTNIAANEYYGLSGQKFVKIKAGTVKAGKAILPISASNGAPELNMIFSGEGTTGIRSIDNGQLTIDNVYYDLSGRRVAEPTKGVYIVNGKKVVIK